MLARFTLISLAVACGLGPVLLCASEPAIPRAQVEKRAALGYAHVRTIDGPSRSVAASDLLVAHLTRPGVVISVVGPLSNDDVVSLLQLLGFQPYPRSTRFSGDGTFAILEIGDLAQDPCCVATILFEKRVGIWSMVHGTLRSH